LNAIREKGLLKMIRGKGTRVLALNERPQNGTVGIVVSLSPSLFSHEPARILEGFRKTLKENKQHYRIVLESELNGILHSDQSLGDYFGGLLFIEATGEEKQIEKLKSLDFPYVVANLESSMEATCTWVNHKKTTNTAVIMLAAMGHKKIALISRNTNELFYKDALEGYKNGIEEAGLDFNDKLLVISDSTEAIGAYYTVSEFLKSNELPDAFVACRDYLAYGACKALTEKNISIGKDVSVIGFDNLTWPEDNSYLTTFSEPAYELGAEAAEMLIERMDSGNLTLEKKEVEAPLILRQSVGVSSASPLKANSLSLKLRFSDPNR